MNAFQKRALTGALFLLAITAAILSGYASYWLLLYAFSIGILTELRRLFGMCRATALKALLLHTVFFLYAISTYLFVDPRYVSYVKYALILLTLLVFIAELYGRTVSPTEDLGKLFVGVLYVALPLGLAARLPFVRASYHAAIILGLFILIWSNDTFAYLIGKCLGKTKLFERISPNKTVEGFLGGLLSTLLAAKLLSLYPGSLGYLDWAVLGILAAVFGTLGDLVASMFKRQFSVKDSGRIFPGHGGFLDRLDSFLFVAPVAYIYIQYTLS